VFRAEKLEANGAGQTNARRDLLNGY